MKCLCISQPFADLVISGKKTIDLRSWNTRFRGEFLVHAPLKIRDADSKRLEINKKFVTGAIVGKAELYQVKIYITQKELEADQKFHFSAQPLQGKVFGFMLKNATLFKDPIPWKGQLGFFDADISKTSIDNDREMLTEIFEEEYRYQWIGHH